MINKKQGRTIPLKYEPLSEEEEHIEESKNRTPDKNFNAFIIEHSESSPIRLEDIQNAFPLGYNFHFAFKNEKGLFLDLTNPRSCVPLYDRKIVMKVMPLVSAPEIVLGPSSWGESKKVSAQSQQQSSPENFANFDANLKDEPTREEPSYRCHKQDWDPSYQNHSSSSSKQDEYYAESKNTKSSERTSASTDAKKFFKKQTEHAIDFAKGMTSDDAKKMASETAKKAKKWGGSLLSSISASISNATQVIKNEMVQVGGMNVNIVRPIAEGAYAQVLLVRTSSNELLAMKRVLCQSEEVERDIHTELQVFRNVKHTNLMPLIEFSEVRRENQEFYFLFPYFEKGTLWDVIQIARNSSSPLWPLNQRVALHLFHGICAGVLALHRAGYCHRDLKPHNIMLSSTTAHGEDFFAYVPIVTDFGSCAPLRVEVRNRKMSLDIQDEANRKSSAPYRAPELFEPEVEGVVDGQSDVWSLGCILYAMAFGSSPFEHPKDGFMKLACMNGRVSFPPEQGGVVRHRNAQYTRELCDFIRDMLHTTPEERPSVQDVLEFTEELLGDDRS